MGDSNLFFKEIFGQYGKDLNVAMVGRVESYDPAKNTIKVIPQHKTKGADGNEQVYQPLISVPVASFNIGGYMMKFPMLAGDIVILLYFDYDIDNLIANGNTEGTVKQRTHSLNDCIALPFGFNLLSNDFKGNNDLTIAKKDGSTFIKIKENGDIVLNSNKIKLGENATKGVIVSNGSSSYVSSKVFAE